MVVVVGGMDGGGAHRTPEDVFRDFRARRAGMIKALTTGMEGGRGVSRFELSRGCFFFFFFERKNWVGFEGVLIDRLGC